jgi:hypothetical protein
VHEEGTSEKKLSFLLLVLEAQLTTQAGGLPHATNDLDTFLRRWWGVWVCVALTACCM